MTFPGVWQYLTGRKSLEDFEEEALTGTTIPPKPKPEDPEEDAITFDDFSKALERVQFVTPRLSLTFFYGVEESGSPWISKRT